MLKSLLNSDRMKTKVSGWFKSNLLLVITFLGVLLGVILGFSLRSLSLSPSMISLLAYPGEMFMRLLQLMILPLVIASLITGAASLNASLNGKIALRTIIYFLATSFMASLGKM